MTLIAEKIYTPEDLLNDPNLAGYELVDGRLREWSVSKRSSEVGARILRLLANEAEKTRDAVVYGSDLGYQCFPDSPTNIRFADVSVILSSRDKEISDDPGYMPVPPDLAVEVLSPNDRIKDVDDKVKDYLKANFHIVWVVNPDWRHVHVYRSDGSVQLLSEQEEITGESVLPGFRCRCGARILQS